ncbi:hypothetical protein Ga0609869_000683 [Rhodovulum iodosum]|uniref:Amidoligase enzyme n=1 Tax=Rhodovulum iodosum TaxID=68291 RepID=A0ABV3XRA9_9RHOB|nr:amidoligase family protein [Rhodovulum robiginosum]RSK31387.1 hypothetical protein EJA01_14675 [Rhodovulum robiginosum]
MEFVTDRIERAAFLPLPRPDTAEGRPRRVGVEIEFGGLTEMETAALVQAVLGGRVVEDTPHEFVVDGTTLGDVEVCLDTALRDKAGTALADLGLELGRAVVPVEIVTAPLTPDDLPHLEDLRKRLRAGGAQGSGGGLFLGFGVHLNPEIEGPEVGHILPVVRAYALLEDWLRKADPIDPSRRLLPFVDPYPRSFVDRLAGAPDWSLGALIDAYLEETPTRNRGLDMLPVFRHLDEARVLAGLDDASAVSARPAYHYRLPDSRLDDPEWTLAYEWNRWVMVERLANRPDALERLARDWLEYREAWTTTRPDWLAHVEARLDELNLWEAA